MQKLLNKIISIDTKFNEISKLNKINNENQLIPDSKFNLLIKKFKKNNIKDNFIHNYIVELKQKFFTNKYFNILINYVDALPIKTKENFLTSEECDSLIKLSSNRYQPSQVNSKNSMIIIHY